MPFLNMEDVPDDMDNSPMAYRRKHKGRSTSPTHPDCMTTLLVAAQLTFVFVTLARRVPGIFFRVPCQGNNCQVPRTILCRIAVDCIHA